jgi:sulfate transport system substrate-binding protein
MFARPKPMQLALGTALLIVAAGVCGCKDTPSAAATEGKPASKELELLNVSYDPTRELYAAINDAFIKDWKASHDQSVKIKQSHGGSGKQARAVIDGLEADVVTLALAYDIDSIADKGKLLPSDWQKRLPNNSSPFVSTIGFVVRKGNPKQIKTWDDLVKPGVQVITPNPKTSGGARWNYLAAWGYALQKEMGDLAKIKDPGQAKAVEAAETKAKAFVAALYKNVPVLDSGARGSTTTFMERGIGDVLINWENELLLGKKEKGGADIEVVLPPSSILAEPTVSLVDKNVDKHGTRAAAEAYLKFLWSDQGQEIGAKNYYRPQNPSILAKYADTFPKLDLFTIEEISGGWKKAQKTHFDDGGVFDQIYQPK